MERYFCTICNKKYASYQSLWNHNKKFHIDIKLYNVNNILPNIINNNINIKYIEKSSIEKLQCGYCKKYYKSAVTKSVHIKSCKKKYPEIQIVNITKICNICSKISNCLSSAYKHRKLCQKKQEQISITNNNN